MPPIPPLPKIDGDPDIILDVYTHSSLSAHLTGHVNDEYGSPERLLLLGKHVLDLAVTHHWYRKVPPIVATELAKKQRESLSEQRLVECIDAFNLHHKLRYAPGVTIDASVCRAFLDSYIGALYIRNGLSSVQRFVSRLIDPGAQLEDEVMRDVSPQRNYSQPGPPPPPPSLPPPPTPSDYSQSSRSSSNGDTHITLAMFNQTATQNRYSVTWQADSSGPPHQPTWTVKCFLNGIEKGRGTGKSQKQAKEDAARQVWQATAGLSRESFIFQTKPYGNRFLG
ncbi:hypothetical protein AMATHDRAFT_62470 [Amanita thiersii Skay4041]|uniref:DRBM domain-containing protein n=1 Tax=Amanita thiersii Skay4041 TaxID=703135 RepID=A0A2A9NGS3_9AGAR|nr:hypothetical protein AMATHDRAFT_62470 [Amanita thiersii Skay4041]